jgi:hypothetical protein
VLGRGGGWGGEWVGGSRQDVAKTSTASPPDGGPFGLLVPKPPILENAIQRMLDQLSPYLELEFITGLRSVEKYFGGRRLSRASACTGSMRADEIRGGIVLRLYIWIQ